MLEVYCHTSPSGKRYVGFSSQGMLARWGQHTRAAARGSRHAFHRAIRKYGPESFTSEVLERMTTEAGAKRAEQLWIAALGTFGAGGYNATRGGEGTSGLALSPERQAKLITAAAAANRGRPRSADVRARIGAAHKGGVRPPEQRAQISAALKGRPLTPERREKVVAASRTPERRKAVADANRARVVSPETREKLAAANRRRRHSDETLLKMSEAQRARRAREKRDS